MPNDQSGTAHREWRAWYASVTAEQAFDSWFQPIVQLADTHVVGYEALARFHDGSAPDVVFQHGPSTPARVGLELGLMAKAVDAGASLPAGTPLHLNASPPAASSPAVRSILELAGRPVVLEVTEHEVFSPDQVRRVRRGLPVGCLLAADDVGVGYAGLAQLLDVRPDIVKIDRTIVAGIDQDRARRALVSGLVQFAHVTGCSVIAEGVERVEEQEALLAAGVSLGQGYLFGRPAPLSTSGDLVGCCS